MATLSQEAQWSKCLASCELCNLTPEGFETYMNNANGRTLECAKTWGVFQDSKDPTAILEGREENTQARSLPEMLETCMSDSFPIPQDVETADMTESDDSSVKDDQDDVWSVVSDVCDSASVQDDSQRKVDEESQADDEKDSDEAADDGEPHAEDEEQRLGNDTDKQDERPGDVINEQATHDDRDNEEDEHFDDCTEEGIRLAEVQKQLEDYKQATLINCYRLETMHRKQLDDTKRQYEAQSVKERERTASACAVAEVNEHLNNRMTSHIRELEEELERSIQAAWDLESELENKRCEELDSLNREHHRQLDQYKLKFKQDCHLLRKALTESENHRRQDAVKHANLFAEAADTLHDQIKKAEDMKVACERTLETTAKVHDIEVAKLQVNCRWLEDKVKRALAKEAEDHDAHLRTRNQLAKAEHEIEELKQKLELAKQEHEADNALNEEHVCDLESEMNEMCQEKDERYHEKDQLCEKMEEAYQDLEITYDHDLSEAKDVIERLEQNLRTVSDELRKVKEEKTQLEKDMAETEATMEELYQQTQESEAGPEQDSSEAASQRQWLEGEVRELRGALKEAKQEDKELRDQLRDAIKGMQESQERQQELKQREYALMSQCAADRLMFERSAYALRSLLQRN